MSRKKAAALTVIGMLHQLPARADGEVWLWGEYEARVLDRSVAPETTMRFTNNARFSSRADGLDFGMARFGPVFSIAPWLSTATTGAAIGSVGLGGRFVQEYRAELDLVPHVRLGDAIVSSRSRFEYVWREAGPFTRYRNMVRVAYAPIGAKWIPFAFFDVFLRPTGPHLQETWSAIGGGRMLGASTRLDVAYMLRTRDGSAGELDHVSWLMLHFAAAHPQVTSSAPHID